MGDRQKAHAIQIEKNDKKIKANKDECDRKIELMREQNVKHTRMMTEQNVKQTRAWTEVQTDVKWIKREIERNGN